MHKSRSWGLFTVLCKQVCTLLPQNVASQCVMIDYILFCLHDSLIYNTKDRFSYMSWDFAQEKKNSLDQTHSNNFS